MIKDSQGQLLIGRMELVDHFHYKLEIDWDYVAAEVDACLVTGIITLVGYDKDSVPIYKVNSISKLGMQRTAPAGRSLKVVTKSAAELGLVKLKPTQPKVE